MGNALTNKAMLVILEISVPSFRKKDKETTTEILRSKKADDEAGHFVASLMPDDPDLTAIKKIAGKTRNETAKMSFPWFDSFEPSGSRGARKSKARVITTKVQMEHTKFIGDQKMAFEKAVKAFVRGYKDKIDQAKKARGKLFKASDYPDASFVKELFRFNCSYEPIPDVDDWRIQISAAEREKIAKQVRKDQEKQIHSQQHAIHERLFETVEKMAVVLSDGKKGFKNTLTGNILEISDLALKMNIAEDPHLTRLAEKAKEVLGTKDPDKLRKDKKERKQTADEAKKQAEEIKQAMESMNQ